MRKLFIFVAIVIATTYSLKAQYTGYIPIADFAKFKTAFAAASQNTISIKSDFAQEKNLSMLSEKIISKGKFWYKKKAKFVWSTTSHICT